jgi:acetyltransferase-like isoleucine patch superfamily enzyme/dTDP-4-dehydrorhamnose 3,5-epimerase-like enzyme
MNEVFTHQNALCESRKVGRGTRIWAFAHVLPGAEIGQDCNICDGVFIENDVKLGNRVTVKCGVQLWDGLTIEDDVFIGPNATFTNDLFPRSRVYPERFVKTIVREGASIGANATILAGVEIGAQSMIGAGAVVTRSVPPNAIVVGNPARIMGYVQTEGETAVLPTGDTAVTASSETSSQVLGVGRAAVYRLKSVRDMRGDLSVGEFERELPFVPKRYFLVYNVPSQEVRGEHAHKACEQFLICVRGSCRVLLDDGTQRREVLLDRPDLGVYMPPMIWGTQYRYSSDAVLLVFASHDYDPQDYIRTYEEFTSALLKR